MKEYNTDQIVSITCGPHPRPDGVAIRLSHFPMEGQGLADREYLEFVVPTVADAQRFVSELSTSLQKGVDYFGEGQAPEPEALTV